MFSSELSEILNNGQSRTIILSGNIHDLFLNGQNKWVPLINFLSSKYLVEPTSSSKGTVVITYALNDNIQITGTQRSEVFQDWERMFPKESLEKRLDETHKNATYAFELMRMITLCSRSNKKYDLIIIIEGTDLLIPDDQVSRMNIVDRKRLAILQDWVSDPDFVNGSDSLILISESPSLIHSKISRLPQLASVAIPYPDQSIRKRFIQDHWKSPEDSQTLLANQTAGLSLYAVWQLIKGKKFSAEEVTKQIEKYICSQLGEGVVDFVKPTHTLDDLVGFELVKTFLIEKLIPRIKSSPETAIPGFAVAGPIGGGKTYIFEAFAAQLGVPVIVMKNMRSQWFGQTDVIFERFEQTITALDQVVVFVDEADVAFGKIDEGHETEKRLTANIQKMMSNPRLKGKVFWILMTARIHLLSDDIRRRGRVGNLIIPILDPLGKDKDEFLKWTFGKLDGFQNSQDMLQKLTEGYSSADFSEIRAEIKSEECKTIDEAMVIIEDALMPDIQETRHYQTLQALVNCTRVSLIPESFLVEANDNETLSERAKRSRILWKKELSEKYGT